jgi:hypothetical protein
MKITKTILFGAVLLIGLAAWAQDFPRYEVSGNYSYARFNPSTNGTKGLSLNGGGGAAVFNINEYLGIKMDLQGFNSNTFAWNIPVSTNFPSGGTFHASGNLFTYMFGPQVKFRSPRFEPFVSLLFGGAHSNAYANAFHALCVNPGSCVAVSGSPSGNGFAMSAGGGFDIPINKTISFRPAEVDWFLTKINNQFNGGSPQNNFRYSAGVNFSFGGGSH